MIHYSHSEARKNFSEIMNRVKFEHIIIGIGRGEKDEVLIIPKPQIDEEIPVTGINTASPSFDFLKDEPDIYSLKDLKRRYV